MVTSANPQNPTPTWEETLQQLRSRLRPGQQRMADWQSGALAVSAVPGSGKSTGMAIASAILLAKRYRGMQPTAPDGNSNSGQLVVVTFTRSAVANLKAKIRQYLRELSLTPSGFVVYTLHGLALNIATRYPDLSGLSLDRVTLVLPNQSNRLVRTCVEQWISSNPQLYQRLLEGRQFDGEETERLRRQSVLRTEVLPELALTVIHEAKSSGLLPADLRQLSQEVMHQDVGEVNYDVLAIAAGLYERYQLLLKNRGLIDYDDMILAALRVLEDDNARQLWQQQVFAVFEDEAQDSSPLQTRLLEILASDPDGNRPANLVRVGDPNQAINSTFTPADPVFFRQFCETCEAQDRLAEMDQAGRSAAIIMDAANFMLDWVNRRYGRGSSGDSDGEGAIASFKNPFRSQAIHPVGADDPQVDANPAPVGRGLEIVIPEDVFETVDQIGQRVAELFAQHPDGRMAVLVRENRQGRFVADLLQNPEQHGLKVNLKELGIEVYDVGQRDRQSHIPAEILALMQFLDRPHSPDNLKAALKVLVDRKLIPTQDLNLLTSLPEQFLYPGPLDPLQPDPVLQAQRYCTGLLRARLELPQYQLIPFLALTLKYEQTELATADKLSEQISQRIATNPGLSPIDVLIEIVNSERFEPVEIGDSEERYTRKGQLTIITMHKAKGLDWDFVFIPFLHEQLIPGSLRVPPQAQFIGDFSLPEVARAQIRARVHEEYPMPGLAAAWERAEYLKVAEEFRLLYVAMTRAKRLLWMSAAQKAPFTWSKPDNLEDKTPCPVLTALGKKFPQAISY
ncbi:ATP-dependent helicase [Oculatella sp. FACHB-28]|uniref:ATP-dependent helicase n=1 Tax=Oculatella sp. FACHB-28 TaxID=2692845 RepID=UPI0016879C45|nr:ATP-dependent helicase [Oculatella sp. FACHB-28]MBD2054970.1 ATP-dependent helicase [Oculatella sp. FACHB-28]